jgi:hypothetical protein
MSPTSAMPIVVCSSSLISNNGIDDVGDSVANPVSCNRGLRLIEKTEGVFNLYKREFAKPDE